MKMNCSAFCQFTRSIKIRAAKNFAAESPVKTNVVEAPPAIPTECFFVVVVVLLEGFNCWVADISVNSTFFFLTRNVQ